MFFITAILGTTIQHFFELLTIRRRSRASSAALAVVTFVAIAVTFPFKLYNYWKSLVLKALEAKWPPVHIVILAKC